MASSTSFHGNVPLQTFNLTNDIKDIDPQDAIFKHDLVANARINREAPWRNESVYLAIRMSRI
jgi:hypothetical protein